MPSRPSRANASNFSAATARGRARRSHAGAAQLVREVGRQAVERRLAGRVRGGEEVEEPAGHDTITMRPRARGTIARAVHARGVVRRQRRVAHVGEGARRQPQPGPRASQRVAEAVDAGYTLFTSRSTRPARREHVLEQRADRRRGRRRRRARRTRRPRPRRPRGGLGPGPLGVRGDVHAPARPRAMPSPMPFVAPVTTATRVGDSARANPTSATTSVVSITTHVEMTLGCWAPARANLHKRFQEIHRRFRFLLRTLLRPTISVLPWHRAEPLARAHAASLVCSTEGLLYN